MSKIQDIIRAAKLPEIALELCLAGHLLAEITELDRQRPKLAGLTESKRKRALSQGRALAKQIEELRDQMQESSIAVRVRAMPKDDWRQHIEQFPPRKGNKGDAETGVNTDAFLDAVIRKTLLADGEPLSTEDFDALMAVIPQGEYDRMIGAVWALNRGSVVVPKSPRESRAAEMSDDD